MPCAEEVRLHNLTHLPFRDWCPFCVQGRAVNAPHYANAKDKEKEVPVIAMDYMGMNRREPSDDTFPVIVTVDSKSRTLGSHF